MDMQLKKQFVLALLIGLFAQSCLASLVVKMARADQYGHGQAIGTIKLDDTIYGLLITPKLHDLSPGMHGFAVHTTASCDDYARMAGGHYDPERNFQHHGPYGGGGHLGDLPVLLVDTDGRARLPLLAPRIKLSDVRHHALVIVAGGDNYSDEVLKLNGSRVRIACGVIPYFN